jgi:nucleoside-diphosphate-sugar epimerase
MEIIGRGFIGSRLAPLAGSHPGVTVLAAGVSSTSVTSPDAFAREIELARDTARRCAGAGRMLVVFSTASHAMYGSIDVPASEESPVVSGNQYGLHKQLLEAVVMDSGARWLVLRLSHLMGPGQPAHHLLPGFAAQIRAGHVRLFRGAHRDVIDVADVVTSLDGLLCDGVCLEVVNVASGTPASVASIVDGIEQRLGMRATWETVDAAPVRTPVSIAKLRRLVPAARAIGGAGYVDRVLDRYVHHY